MGSTVTSVTQGSFGAVSINGNGTITYMPNAGDTGPDSSDYALSDGNGGRDIGMVSVMVNS